MSDTVIYRDYDRAEVRPLYRSTQVVWYAFYVIETILLFRFALRLIGANTGAAFTQFVYALSSPFIAPFRNIVGNLRVFGSAVEWSTLIAMVAYWVLAWGIVRLIAMNRPVTRTEAQAGLREQDAV